MNERLGSRESEMRKDELKPEVRRYVEKLEAQIKQKLAGFGFKKSSELQAAITEGSPSFEFDTERRTELLKASDELAELVVKHKEAKESDELPASDFEYVGDQDFIEKHEDQIFSLMIGGKTKLQLVRLLERADVEVGSVAEQIIASDDFVTREDPEEIHIIRLTLKDLEFNKKTAIKDIRAKAAEIGLEACPAEVGLHYALSNEGRSFEGVCEIGMEPIITRSGRPNILNLINKKSDRYLYMGASVADPDSKRSLEDSVLFALRKKKI